MMMARYIQEYMAWFRRELMDGILCDKTSGELTYLFGQEFINATDFDNPETLARFGIKTVWFARYFKRNVKLPTLEGGHRTLENSQIRLKVDLTQGVTNTPEWQEILKTYLLEQLGLTADLVDEVKLETNEVCCHSPCYGCLCFSIDKAIEKQGEQPFLIAMKAGIDQQSHHDPIVN
jgi:hypothetical protein